LAAFGARAAILKQDTRCWRANGQLLAYIYYECEPGRRKLLSKARRIAVNIAKGSGAVRMIGGVTKQTLLQERSRRASQSPMPPFAATSYR
jgi:hypothetical protein